MITIRLEQPAGVDLDRRLMHSLAVALRTVEIYEPDNTAAKAAIDDVFDALSERPPDPDGWRIDVRNRCLYIDGERVRASAADYLNHGRLLETLESWGIGTLTFLPGTGRDDVVTLVHTLSRTRERGLDTVRARLQSRGFAHITVEPPAQTVVRGEEATPVRTYASCIHVYREVCEAIRGHEQLKTRRLRRVTQAVVNSMLADEYALIALTTLKEFDEYLFNHSVNVAILSVALGQRVGLTRPQLGELCLAAFLHDLGKVALPHDLVAKPGKLTDDEWSLMRRHPLDVVYILLSQQTLSPAALRAIVTGFEHHMNFDLSGYPKVRHKKSVSLFGRIITVADRYDAVTTPRSYRTRNFTPYEGVRHLLDKAGTEFDPIMVKVFIETMGLYPPGSLLGLDTGEIGVVQRPPAPGEPLDRPWCAVMRGAAAGELVDLTERDAAGDYRRSVLVVFSPAAGRMPALSPETLAELDLDELGPATTADPSVLRSLGEQAGTAPAEG